MPKIEIIDITIDENALLLDDDFESIAGDSKSNKMALNFDTMRSKLSSTPWVKNIITSFTAAVNNRGQKNSMNVE